MLRVVASYTTLPSRYEVLYKSILSLRNQTYPLDAIYLTIPKKATRLNKEYPPLTDELTNSCIIVHTDIDYGPLTKIYGALMSESDPNTIIISCDDDVDFPENFIETLISKHNEHPEVAICGTGALLNRGLWFISIVSSIHPFDSWKGTTGFSVGKNGRDIDLVFGVAGVLYTRNMFPDKELLYDELFHYSLTDDSIFCNDDVLISGYLSKKNIKRRVFLDIPTIKHLNGDDALSGDIFKMIKRLNVAIAKVKELGFFTEMEPVGIAETPCGRVLIALIFIIVIVLVCVYIFMNNR